MQIMAALQNGTAFFASTSLLAVGGALALFRSTEVMLKVLAILPLGIETSRILWEVRSCSRLLQVLPGRTGSDHVAILLGAMPFASEKDTPAAEAHVVRTAFTRPHFAARSSSPSPGWFISPWVLIVTTAAAVW